MHLLGRPKTSTQGAGLVLNAGELYTLLHFLDPVTFPSTDAFEERFGELSSKQEVERLHKAMKPYFLRRMKADVEKNVPPKEETVVQVELTAVQKQWYRAVRTLEVTTAGIGALVLTAYTCLYTACAPPVLACACRPASVSVSVN